MSVRNQINYCLHLLFLLPALAVQAQPESNTSIQAAPTNTLGVAVQRIVDECEINGAQTLCSSTGQDQDLQWKTVSLQIPGFKPEDRERKVYVMADIRGLGHGSGSVHADEYGMLVKQEIDRHSLYMPNSVAGMLDEDAQYYFVEMDVYTLEARTTLDLYQVPLLTLLDSLQNSLSGAMRQATRTSMPRDPASRPRPLNSDPVLRERYGETRVSLRGEKLLPDEVLDLLYEQSGCLVEAGEQGFVLRSCP